MGNATYKPVVKEEQKNTIYFKECLPHEQAVIVGMFIDVIKNYEFDFTDLINEKIFTMRPMEDMSKKSSIKRCWWGGISYNSNENTEVIVGLSTLLLDTMKEVESIIHEKLKVLKVPYVYTIKKDGYELNVHVQLVHGISSR